MLLIWPTESHFFCSWNSLVVLSLLELPVHGKGNVKTIYRYLRAAKVEILPRPPREESLEVAAIRRLGGGSHTRGNPSGTLWQLKHHLWNKEIDSFPGKGGEKELIEKEAWEGTRKANSLGH